MASVAVLAGAERRRRWSIEQKRAIVAAAFKPGAVVRDVARQADVTSSLIYRWRRDLGAAASGFAQVLLAGASYCWRVQLVDPIRLLNSAAVHYWVQNAMALISRDRIGPKLVA